MKQENWMLRNFVRLLNMSRVPFALGLSLSKTLKFKKVLAIIGIALCGSAAVMFFGLAFVLSSISSLSLGIFVLSQGLLNLGISALIWKSWVRVKLGKK